MFVASWVGQLAASTAAYCACSACQCTTREILRSSARVAYCFLFFLGTVAAWVLRDFAKPLIEKIPWIMRAAAGIELKDEWFGQQAVYRVSLGQFLYFAFLAAATFGVKYKNDNRAKYLHHGNWLLKLGVWLLISALPFFFPNSVVNAYGWVAMVGAGFFLVIQMVILLDFTQAWNDAWVAEGEKDVHWLYGLLVLTIAAFSATLAIAGLLFYWFKPAGAGSCSMNVAFITITLVICVAVSIVSLHPLARAGSLFPASCISLYCMYLCYSALQSEPHDFECNGLAKRLTAASGSTMAIGMLLTIASVVYSAFRAGSNSALFSLEEDTNEQPLLSNLEQGTLTSAGLDGEEPMHPALEHKDEKPKAIDDFVPVAYNYSFFHLIFALASMYIGMLMTGWGSGAEERNLIDVGWASVWVKFGALLLTSALYAWSLLAPVIFPDREFA